MARIDHTNHSHPTTPAARAECRKVSALITKNHNAVMEAEVAKVEAAGCDMPAYLREHMLKVTTAARVAAKVRAAGN